MKAKNNVQVQDNWYDNSAEIAAHIGLRSPKVPASDASKFDRSLIKQEYRNELKNHNKTKSKETKLEEIVYIDTDCLVDYEKQAEVYGEPEVEPEFVASVKDMGILTPLTVATDGLAGTYIIISGHRRRRAAEEAGLDAVPCIIKEYENAEEMELEFLASNMQREKTKLMRVREFLHYKQILCQLGKKRMGSGVYTNTIYENPHFWRILQSSGLDKYAEPGKPQNSIEILKGITNYSEYEQKAINVLYGENWLQDVYDDLRSKSVAESTIEQIGENFYAVREKYEAEEISLNEAVKSVKDMVAEVHKALDKKAEKKAKAKPAKAEKAQKAEKPKLTLAIEVKVKRTYSETPMKFSEADGVAEFYLRRGAATFGVVRNSGMVTGIAAEIDGKVYNINLDLLAQTLEEAI